MKGDKELMMKLLAACERLFFERSVLESLLVGAQVPGWRPMHERLMKDDSCRAPVRALFRPAFEQAQREANWELAIEEFLSGIERGKKPN
jgi:hypothetical protein